MISDLLVPGDCVVFLVAATSFSCLVRRAITAASGGCDI